MKAYSGLSLMTEQKFDFEALYRTHAEKILNLAFRMTGREDVAKDLTQDVFLKLYEHYGDFRGDSRIYTWIYRIAVNHILNYLKREKRMRWFDLLDKNVSDLFQKKSYESDWGLDNRPIMPLEQMEKSQREKIVWRAIQSLPLNYRVPLLLHRYEELSYQEIAANLNLSLSAVESRIHRAKKSLSKKLKPWLGKI